MSRNLIRRSDKGQPLTAEDHDANIKRLGGFADPADLIANAGGLAAWIVGDIITTDDGFRYEVLAGEDTDEDLETAGGMKLRVLPGPDGRYNFRAWAPAADNTTDDYPKLRAALDRAGIGLRIPEGSYYISTTLHIVQKSHVSGDGRGTILRFPSGIHGIVFHISGGGIDGYYSTSDDNTAGAGGISRNLTTEALTNYATGLVKYDGSIYCPLPGASAAQLVETAPDASERWVLRRAVDERDASIPMWETEQPSGTYPAIPRSPLDSRHHYFRYGSYVYAAQSDTYFKVLPDDAEEFDIETMFGMRLQAVEPIVRGMSQGSSLENLDLDGSSPASLTGHGVWLRAPGITIKDVRIQRFGGNGFNIQAAVPGEAPGAPHIWGNANTWHMETPYATSCGNIGIHVSGSDTNGGFCIGPSVRLNGRMGLKDHSFLGNTYIGGHSATNGLQNSGANAASGRSSVVSYGGDRYRAKYRNGGGTVPVATTEQDLIDTEPGTNSDVWERISSGGPLNEYPLWQPGQPLGTYFLGAGYMLTNNNARTVVIGCYSETDEAGNIFAGNHIMNIGGIQERIQSGSQIMATSGGIVRARRFAAEGSELSARLGHEAGGAAEAILTAGKSGAGLEHRLKWTGNDLRWDIGNSDNLVPFRITGQNTAQQFGTGAPVPGLLHAGRIAIGDRRHTNGTAAPTSGDWARGDIVWNRTPSAGGNAGWICVEAGEPGVWKQFGAIEV